MVKYVEFLIILTGYFSVQMPAHISVQINTNTPGEPETLAFAAIYCRDRRISLSVNIRKTYSYGEIID
jgi:hypothetical protein